MKPAAILITLLLAQVASASTWKVWVHPAARTTAQTKSWQTNWPPFFTRGDFEDAVRMASDAVGKHCNWKLEVTRNRSEAHITIVSHNPSSYYPMYLGNGSHAAGMWIQEQGVVIINDGWIPAGMSRNYSYWYDMVGDKRGLAGLILHEIGHHNWLLGNTHNPDMRHLMRANPPANLLALVHRKFGKPKPPKPDPKPDPPKPDPKPEPPKPIDNIWHNKDMPADVNGDGRVSAWDALRVINVLNRKGGSFPIEDLKQGDDFYDVTGDREVTSGDALRVISDLRRNRAVLEEPIVDPLPMESAPEPPPACIPVIHI